MWEDCKRERVNSELKWKRGKERRKREVICAREKERERKSQMGPDKTLNLLESSDRERSMNPILRSTTKMLSRLDLKRTIRQSHPAAE